MARAAFGITLYPQDARYNQAASLALSFTSADLAAGDTGGTLEPTENNLKTVNDAVVTRTSATSSASSARYTQPTGQPYAPDGPGGIGVYNTSPAVNVKADADLYSRAAWLVHLGTVDSDRYPTLPLNLRRRPAYADDWATTAIGDRVTVDGIFATGGQDPDVLVEGWVEVLGRYQWDVVANCSPYAPWRVFQLGDSQLGRLDTGGSALTADATAGATTLTVAVTTGVAWTTTASRPTDFPFDIEVGGIQITVTGITGSGPYTFTVTGVTKNLHAGDTVQLWQPGVIAL